ncbi:MAG: 16S rRNA (uracil(1498)-N(3))-methyltransferase [Eubacteriales bacterium]|jgi:16S rRNA (uracil1498-N3)-methyltransferase
MPRFFVTADRISDDTITITGSDAHHILRVLRMRAGEHITICDMKTNEYDCIIEKARDDIVVARIVSSRKTASEPPYRARLFQALPKGDKLDYIIQKAVECGVYEITPFESERCVVRSKPENEDRKTERRCRVAHEAAKQCGRGIVPEVRRTLDFDAMLREAKACDLVLFCYEGDGTLPLGRVLAERRINHNTGPDIAIIIGPEGGFTFVEVEAARKSGAILTGLGKRILRTETAAAFVLACLSYEYELRAFSASSCQ